MLELRLAGKILTNVGLFVMKMFIRSLTAVVGLAFSTVTSHAALTLDFSSTLGSSIQFNGSGSSFQFNTSSSGVFAGTQFYVTSESGSANTGSAVIFL